MNKWLVGLLAYYGKSLSLNSDSVAWTLKPCNQPPYWTIPATVPGQVHLDLIKNGIIVDDPLYRDNELNYKWVA